MSGAQVLATAGITSSALLAGGLARAAGVVMLIGNGLALLVERRRGRN